MSELKVIENASTAKHDTHDISGKAFIQACTDVTLVKRVVSAVE